MAVGSGGAESQLGAPLSSSRRANKAARRPVLGDCGRLTDHRSYLRFPRFGRAGSQPEGRREKRPVACTGTPGAGSGIGSQREWCLFRVRAAWVVLELPPGRPWFRVPAVTVTVTVLLPLPKPEEL